MIKLYGGSSPNVIKPLIFLEEVGAAYERIPVDLLTGEQFTPEFLAISPNNRIPAIVDDEPADGGAAISVFESGAILFYLAGKHKAFLPDDVRERVTVTEWVMWQMAGQGPMCGQAGHFRNYAPEKLPYAIDRYSNEVKRLYGVLNTRLAGRDYIAADYSIADMACWPWILFRSHHGVALEEYPHLDRWYRRVELRPVVQRLFQDFEIPAPMTFTDEERAILFEGKRK